MVRCIFGKISECSTASWVFAQISRVGPWCNGRRVLGKADVHTRAWLHVQMEALHGLLRIASHLEEINGGSVGVSHAGALDIALRIASRHQI